MNVRHRGGDLIFGYMLELAHEPLVLTPLVHLVDQRRLAAEAWHVR
jgi:hypothetical protein